MSFCKKILALMCVFSLLCGCLIPVHADDDIDPSAETDIQETVDPTVTDPTEETTQATETTAGGHHLPHGGDGEPPAGGNGAFLLCAHEGQIGQRLPPL